ncbi:hypothetical protein [Kordiimonas sp.]|uniref:hypothetical protein n=1 Tax=Kordiimonas sp. TaxID=1970157 RepID=UPI003A93E722
MSFFGAQLPAVLADDLVLVDNGLSAGYATVAWPDVDGSSFVLEQKTATGWRELYSGPDRASTLSGLADGTYLFRLKVEGVPALELLEVKVEHHPLVRAWTFFAIGAVMFLVLVGLLLKGQGVSSLQSFDKISSDNVEQ